MRVELLQGAEADLLEAYVRLEEQGTGFGERFYRTLDFALERLRQHPQMAPVYLGDYRRLVLRPFRLRCSTRSLALASSSGRFSICGKIPKPLRNAFWVEGPPVRSAPLQARKDGRRNRLLRSQKINLL